MRLGVLTTRRRKSSSTRSVTRIRLARGPKSMMGIPSSVRSFVNALSVKSRSLAARRVDMASFCDASNGIPISLHTRRTCSSFWLASLKILSRSRAGGRARAVGLALPPSSVQSRSNEFATSASPDHKRGGGPLRSRNGCAWARPRSFVRSLGL